MTSIEWLFNNLKELGYIPLAYSSHKMLDKLVEDAKEMHKQEIIDAWEDGQDSEYDYHINNERRENAMEYYQETFKKD